MRKEQTSQRPLQQGELSAVNNAQRCTSLSTRWRALCAPTAWMLHIVDMAFVSRDSRKATQLGHHVNNMPTPYPRRP